ncbi:shufflon system plasmid conjugative transfer pilus tip adhesin PilV [Gulbenkiania mobilis]|uniref:shufflon system plasmid conjugative transfer pilus tip adhesin PilV n=1 Tax=Gulbenkiania mobilis TaxID=397457 RepID=UPI0009F8BC71|nr:shufflon system plasmid conjugative transfer pilus tip adhesin PilV [Gulbenkiania mobilis]
MKNTVRIPTKTQNGSTLLEFLLASAVLGTMVTAGYQWMNRSQEDTDLSIAAQHHKLVFEAATEYVRENQSTIIASATPTTPYKITVATLIAAGKLPSGYNPVNNFGQTQCVLVLEPSANTLATLVVSEGGTTMTDFQLARAVAEVGASGGGIYSTSSTAATGSDGGWSITSTTTPKLSDFLSANCSGTAANTGHFASSNFYSSGTLATNYLHRSNDPGRYDQTKMTDPLGLAVETENAACDGVNEKGRLAVDSNDKILACQNNSGWKWTAVGGGTGYWKDPVSNYASLPASGNATGDARITTDTGRAFTWTGAAWKALAIDQSGNLTVPATLSVNGTQIQGNGGTNTWIKQSGTLHVTNAAASAYTDLAANDITAKRRTTTNDLQINTVVTEGTACSPNGLVARDANGLILSCQSGVWKRTGASSLSPSDPGAFWEPALWNECVNTCPAGYAVVGIKTYKGETGNTGCGQGSLVATPLCAPLR